MATTTAPVLTIPEQVRQAAAAFAERFGRAPTVAAAAPGRVNLIGEHTDYNDGFVLPMAIERQTVIVADRRADRRATVASTDDSAVPSEFVVDARLAKGPPHDWANYVKGVVYHSLAAGFDAGGFDALVDSTVPIGGGLSSSAALEMSTATIIAQLAGKTMDPKAKALIGQKAEHTFADVPCGIMDQFISSLGQAGHAMLLDCRSLEPKMVPLADAGVAVLIANSNKKHKLTGGEYKERREQCEAAAQALGVKVLRDVTLEQLRGPAVALPPLALKRARHVVGENQRTVEAAAALAGGQWQRMGELMFQSHVSLRDDFQVSTPELDLLVELARQKLGQGVYGARMTGGGFGGCTVTLLQTQAIDAVTKHLSQQYQARTGITPTIFATRPAAGAQVVELA